MIAFPRTTVPVPDAVALYSARQLPSHVRAAIEEAGTAGRLLATTTGPQYAMARQLLHQRMARANRVLGAYNPKLIQGWDDLPGLQLKEA